MQRTTARTAAALVACSAAAALAQPALYLAEYKFNDPLLSRMDPGGGNVVVLEDVIPPTDWLVVGLFIDQGGGKIYWTHGGFQEGRISRANLDGSDPEVLVASQTNPRGLAVDLDAGLMFWSDTQDQILYRAELSGANRTAIRASAHQFGRPTVDPAAQSVYYGNLGTGEIRRCDYDGSNDVLVVAGGDDPAGIALDTGAGKIYWTDAQTVTNYIARADLDGTDVEILVDFPLASSGLADIHVDPDAGAIYWIDEITDQEKGVWTAALDGSDARRVYQSPAGWNAGALAFVAGGCRVDVNGDGVVNTQDFIFFLNAWTSGDDLADWNGDGLVNTQDFIAYLNDWVAGC